MIIKQNLAQKSCIVVTLLIFVGFFASCNNDKSDNSRPFEFLGEAIGRPENFDKDTIVTPENIDSLYRKYTVETLFNGDYYLIRSKKSYTTSRYLSRLIQMKNGRQVAAKTFYDSEIDANAVLRMKNRLIIGLNSLRDNYYDSTFHMSTHKCRIVVLSDSLTPILGKRYYSQRGHTYIESLMQNTDSTFFCSVVSGDVEFSPKARYQSRVRYNLYIEREKTITDYFGYEIKIEELDLSKSDWGNDLSDEVLKAEKAEIERNDRNALTDSIRTNPNDSVQNVRPVEISIPTVPSNPRIPKDFVLVPSGTLKNQREWNDNREVVYSVSVDSFYICKYELTQAEYKRIAGTLLPENYTWNIQIDYKDAKVVQQGDSIPVIGTYQEFAEYCNKRSRMEGYDGFYEIDGNRVKIKNEGNGYRLLNHFEWTYAARGGNANERYSYAGSNKIGEVAWYGGNSKYRPHEVGLKKANSLGIYDMSGNVSEMLLDDPKSPYRLIGGEGFEYWVNLGPDDILGMFEKNRRNGTRIALIPRKMTNNNTKLTWKFKW